MALILALGHSLIRPPLSLAKEPLVVASKLLHTTQERHRGSFFNQRNAQELWKANTSVSSQGKQRGRARSVMRIKNLNRGQKLGFGKAGMAWPGLSMDATDKKGKLARVEQISEARIKQYEDGVQQIQNLLGSKRSRKMKQTALERGWTGARPQGKKYYQPMSIDPAVDFSGFESVLIEHKTVTHMTGKFGRVRSISMLMVTGNKRGLAGFSLTTRPAKGGGFRSASNFQKAVDRAGMKLMQLHLFEGRTVFHDFFTQFGGVRLFVFQREPGHGIVAHRTIKAACEVIGIKDIEVVLDGSTNYLHIIKAFFLGLMRQRTHQALADEKGLYLVELKEENLLFPKVVAAPSDGKVRTEEELLPNEIRDFQTIGFESHLPFIKPKAPPFWTRLPGWQLHVKKTRPTNHRYEQKIQMLADHGQVCSHLSELYPECVPFVRRKREKKDEEEEAF